ncbi:DUF3016 domain-containing protein [Variovorax sp. HJSM1_2]|uniref:DUF3016 domain-containing protein n=1 Tax=Variovorax sp. HJSM1_2 TaxID=3366263 RepID=UPI003BE4B0B5
MLSGSFNVLLRGLAALTLVGVLSACATNTSPEAAAQRTAAARLDDVVRGPVTVHFSDPSQYSSAYDFGRDGGNGQKAWLPTLAQHLADKVGAKLPPGQQVEVSITNVERAGRTEPWRAGPVGDVRIVRDIYPPRLDLQYTQRAADGQVLRSGPRQLRDNTFMANIDRYPGDPLRYEKQLVDDWVDKEFTTKGG